MAIFYKKYQNKNGQNNGFGKWYGLAVMQGTVGIDDLSEEIQKNCSMKKSDVKAVIEELIDVMCDKLHESYRVRLDGLGTFKMGLKTEAANSKDEFDAQHVKGARVIFIPYGKRTRQGYMHRKMLEGFSLKDAASLTNTPKASSGNNTSGSEEQPATEVEP